MEMKSQKDSLQNDHICSFCEKKISQARPFVIATDGKTKICDKCVQTAALLIMAKYKAMSKALEP